MMTKTDMRGFGGSGTDGTISDLKIAAGSFYSVISCVETSNGLQTTNTGIDYTYSGEREGGGDLGVKDLD